MSDDFEQRARDAAYVDWTVDHVDSFEAGAKWGRAEMQAEMGRAYDRGVAKGVDAMSAEIERLKGELELAKVERNKMDIAAGMYSLQVDELKAEVKRYKEFVWDKRFVKHQDGCLRYDYECFCGLREARQALEVKKEGR
jgi:hypothetical protein